MHIAPLVSFRIIFGAMMLISTLRFILKGWVEELYVKPKFFFTYLGFDWIQPLDEQGMYMVFLVMLISSTGILLGAWYRISSVLFFLCFTYVELIDKTNYLNHYYFVSLVAFLMIWLPAHRYASIDVLRNPKIYAEKVQAGFINVLRFQLGLVYFFAGVAKINPDWLVRSQPLSLWLSASVEKPVIGFLFRYKLTAVLLSWFGMIYDLTIPFLLSFRRTRSTAYLAVIVFHLLTWYLFPIGMFPFIMIGSTLLFFSEKWHKKFISPIERLFHITSKKDHKPIIRLNPSIGYLFIIFAFFQLVLPFRYLLYPGDLFWTEQGYRFSWRVMLMEKAGYVTFKVTDPEKNKKTLVYPYQYLTPQQEKMMATQPDMILQFAHFLEKEFREKGINDPMITADAYVTINGRPGKRFIDPSVDLTRLPRNWHHKRWVLSHE